MQHRLVLLLAGNRIFDCNTTIKPARVREMPDGKFARNISHTPFAKIGEMGFERIALANDVQSSYFDLPAGHLR